MGENYDVVVVGGGSAGLSAAVTLARSRRSVLVVDAGAPRNASAGHMHNYLAREGTPPGELLAAGRAEAASYGGEFVSGTVVSAQRLTSADQDGGHDGDDHGPKGGQDEGHDRDDAAQEEGHGARGDQSVGHRDGPDHGRGFRVTLADGRAVLARRLLVATGLVDELPDVPGMAERWGRDVVGCPYCHGWEIRDQAIGVLATGPMAIHQALMFRQLSADVTLFLHTAPVPGPDELEQLAARGITLVHGEVVAVEVSGDRLTGVRLRSGAVVPRQAVAVAPRFAARADMLATLGLEPVEQEMNGHVIGTVVPADATGATAVPGVWVAGNVADMRAQVISAAAAGVNTAAVINADLIAEETRHAVATQRMFTEQSWEERYRSNDGLWSGRPNPQLVAETTDLTPGTALDVGSGEGADALWLASRGWQVTAVDFSTVALQRAATHAETLGADVADRVSWVHADVTTWTPVAGRFDLVSAQFMHLLPAQRRALFARLADAVAPGGTLLIVGHHMLDLQTTMSRPAIPDMFFTAEEIAGSLNPDRWEVLVTEARPRSANDPEGREITIHDAVLRARRRP